MKHYLLYLAVFVQKTFVDNTVPKLGQEEKNDNTVGRLIDRPNTTAHVRRAVCTSITQVSRDVCSVPDRVNRWPLPSLQCGQIEQ